MGTATERKEEVRSEPNALTQRPDFEFAALSEARNYRAAMLREFAPYLRGNVLEVGAGIGQMSAGLRKTPGIQRLILIEPDAVFCARLRDEFPHDDVIEGTISDLRLKLDWNTIVSINVLEHIESDLEELKAYRRLLSPTRGSLCLFVPARPEIYAPIDRDFGHYRRYRGKELRAKLEKSGFRLLRMRYYSLVGYAAWWLSFCLLKRRSFDVVSVRLFDRLIFPAVHSFETRVCAPPIGQSLMAVAIAG